MKFKTAFIALLGTTLLWSAGCSNKRPLMLGESITLEFDGPVQVSYSTKDGLINKSVEGETVLTFNNLFKGSGKPIPNYDPPSEPSCFSQSTSTEIKTIEHADGTSTSEASGSVSLPTEGKCPPDVVTEYENEKNEYNTKFLKEIMANNEKDIASLIKAYFSSNEDSKLYHLTFGYNPKESMSSQYQDDYLKNAIIKNTDAKNESELKLEVPISISGATLTKALINRFERACKNKNGEMVLTPNKPCGGKLSYFTGKMMPEEFSLEKNSKKNYYDIIAAQNAPLTLVIKTPKKEKEIVPTSTPVTPLANNPTPAAPGAASDCSLAMGNIAANYAWIWMMGTSLLGLLAFRNRNE